MVIARGSGMGMARGSWDGLLPFLGLDMEVEDAKRLGASAGKDDARKHDPAALGCRVAAFSPVLTPGRG